MVTPFAACGFAPRRATIRETASGDRESFILGDGFPGFRLLLTIILMLWSPLIGMSAEAQDEPVSPKVRDAVGKALVWLRDNQKPNGTWPQGGPAGTTAVPSLGVLAFLSRGHVPGQGPYGDVLNKSIDFVLDSQKDNGMLSGGEGNAIMYEHGISTVMLAEVEGMVDDARRSRIDKALGKAVKLILDAQKVQKSANDAGGWRYQPNSPDADISCTGWQLMALRGAANAGASVPKSALDGGLQYIKRCAVPTGGFSYRADNGPANQARTGTGILATILIGGNKDAPEAVAGGDFLLANPPDRDIDFYFYAIYYDSQALNQLGGKYWEQVYPKLVDYLLKLQQDNGAFRYGGGNSQENEAGEAYRTSMAVLALCVPYRYLPLYQADK